MKKEQALAVISGALGIVLILVIFELADHFSLKDHYRRGKEAFLSERYDQAAGIFKKALGKRSPLTDYILYYLGESNFRAGHYAAAEKDLQQLIQRYPSNVFIEKAQYRLLQIAVGRGKQLSAAEKFRFAKGLFGDKEYGPAAEKFSALLEEHPNYNKRGEAYHYLGLCWSYLREYQSAIDAFNMSLRYGHDYVAKSFWWSAQAYQKLGLKDKALARYQSVYNNYPRSELAPQALAAAAQIHLNLGQQSIAALLYTRLRGRYPDDTLAAESYWNEAYSFYRRGDRQNALDIFLKGYKNSGDTLYAPALGFWAAKSAEKLGNKSRSVELFEDVLANYDHNYYAYRAAQLLGRKMPPIKNGLLKSLGRPMQWNRRYRALLEQKAYDDAWLEVEDLVVSADAKARAMTYLELGRVAVETGHYLEGLQFLESFLNTRVFTLKQIPQEFWGYYYPRPYFKLVRDAARRYHLELEALFGLIREESKFNRTTISSAGAYGLMQLMPATAQLLMRKRQVSAELLFEPRTNIDLGAMYLSRMKARFKGDIYLALAAYNAGPEAVARWVANVPTQDIEDWVELIPYGETRNYVKRVLRSYWEYQRLY